MNARPLKWLWISCTIESRPMITSAPMEWIWSPWAYLHMLSFNLTSLPSFARRRATSTALTLLIFTLT
ncbi:uncharacterized protein J3R85_013011 [Psidium guajava]|nr:uncharacterized protein J3R85_013011 [Psidium guajava]